MTSCHLDNRVVFVHRNITNYIIYQHPPFFKSLQVFIMGKKSLKAAHSRCATMELFFL